MSWESSTDIHTPPCVQQLVGSCYRAQGAQPVLSDDLEGRRGEEVQVGGDICIHLSDSLGYIAKMKTTL